MRDDTPLAVRAAGRFLAVALFMTLIALLLSLSILGSSASTMPAGGQAGRQTRWRPRARRWIGGLGRSAPPTLHQQSASQPGRCIGCDWWSPDQVA